MAVTFASFQLLGRADSSKDVLKIIARSLACIFLFLLKTSGVFGLVLAISHFSTHSVLSVLFLQLFQLYSVVLRNSAHECLVGFHCPPLQKRSKILIQNICSFLISCC